MNKIFHAAESVVAPGAAASAASTAAAPQTAPPGPSAATSVTTPATPTPAGVDVEAVCSTMATQKGGGGNWRTSIVDLLKLLDLDSSLASRKQLAGELDVHVGADGTAEENIALHKAVMTKLAANGGKVPESMKA